MTKHVYFFHTRGLKYVKGKPRRSWMRPCEFKKERPQLVIKRIDKGAYFQIELGFKINGKFNCLHYPNFLLKTRNQLARRVPLGKFQ